MITKELLDYIKKERLKDVSLEDIKKILLDNNWGVSDVEEAIKTLYPSASEILSEKIHPIAKTIPDNSIIQNRSNLVDKTIAVPIIGFTGNPISSQPVNQKKINKNRKKWLEFSLLIVFLIGGAVAYGYYNGYFASLPKISAQALESAQKANSMAYDITLRIDFSGIKENELLDALPGDIFSTKEVSINTKGAYDKDPTNFKLNNILTLGLGVLNTTIETRILNNMLYAQITEIPQLPFFLADLSSLENKWVVFSLKDTESLVQNIPSINNIIGIDSTLLVDLTQEQKDKLTQITQKAKFIKITQKLPLETINDQASYHFIFVPDFIGIKAYLQEVRDYINLIGKNDSRLSSFDPIANYDTAINSITNFTGEAWIGKKDNLPRKIIIKITNLLDVENPDKGEITLNLVGIFSDWNKPVNPAIPTESMTLEELLNQFGTQNKINSIDNAIKNKMNLLRSSANLYFENNLKNGANSFVGFCSSAEVKKTITEIKALNNISQVECKELKTKYIISTNLSDNTYFCIDSFGASKVFKKKPTGLICQE